MHDSYQSDQLSYMKFRSEWRHWSIGIWTPTRGKNSRSRNEETDSAHSEVPIYWLVPLSSPNPTDCTSTDVHYRQWRTQFSSHCSLALYPFLRFIHSHDHADAVTTRSHTSYQTCKHTTTLHQPCFHRKLNQLKQLVLANLQHTNTHRHIGLYCGNIASGTVVLQNTGKFFHCRWRSGSGCEDATIH